MKKLIDLLFDLEFITLLFGAIFFVIVVLGLVTSFF